jgi:signal transduction histidine kinase/CheY-like chemotaxis protein
LWIYYKSYILTPENVKKFYFLILALTTVSASLLGSSAFLILPEELVYQIILVFMFVSLSAGASVSLASRIELVLIYIVLNLVLFIYIFSLSNDKGVFILAIILLAYTVMLSAFAKRISASTNENILFAYEKEQLVERLIKESKAAIIQKEKAEELAKVKSTFLANMSHELRTPLNSIIGFSQILSTSENVPAREKNFIEKIHSSGNHLLKLINSILDLSKIEAQQLKLENSEINLRDIVYEVVEQFEYQAKEKNILMKTDYTSDRDFYLGDSLRISQVLTNLISNAIKFTKAGEISVTVSKPEKDRVRFEIKDSGIGLTKEQIAKLFQAFAQADDSTTKEYGGTGLGLMISKEIILMMDGKIWVESESGIGSNFIFEISLDETNHVPQAQNAEVDYKTLLEAIKQLDSTILLVEDNKTNQLVITSMLRESKMKIDIANNGQEAVDMFKDKTYDLVLMDLQMPVLNGFEACKSIREDDNITPIVALSANIITEEIEKTKELGMNEYLSKPIEINKLYGALLRYLKK